MTSSRFRKGNACFQYLGNDQRINDDDNENSWLEKIKIMQNLFVGAQLSAKLRKGTAVILLCQAEEPKYRNLLKGP